MLDKTTKVLVQMENVCLVSALSLSGAMLALGEVEANPVLINETQNLWCSITLPKRKTTAIW